MGHVVFVVEVDAVVVKVIGSFWLVRGLVGTQCRKVLLWLRTVSRILLVAGLGVVLILSSITTILNIFAR